MTCAGASWCLQWLLGAALLVLQTWSPSSSQEWLQRRYPLVASVIPLWAWPWKGGCRDREGSLQPGKPCLFLTFLRRLCTLLFLLTPCCSRVKSDKSAFPSTLLFGVWIYPGGYPGGFCGSGLGYWALGLRTRQDREGSGRNSPLCPSFQQLPMSIQAWMVMV